MRNKRFLRLFGFILSLVLFITSVPEIALADILQENSEEIEIIDNIDVSDNDMDVIDDVSGEEGETIEEIEEELEKEIDIENESIADISENELSISLRGVDVKGYCIASGKSGKITWSIDDSGFLLIEGTGDASDKPWLAYKEQIKSAKVDVRGMTDANTLFSECRMLKTVDFSDFDTSSVTDMASMFSGCESLASLNLSSFNTSSVTDMSGMFCDCKSLTSLDLRNFNTSSVKDMSIMFAGCSALKSLNLSSFNTSSVRDMREMFFLCSSLTSLNLSKFNNSAVKNMKQMFYGCSSLTSLNLSGFKTSSVTNMDRMFVECESLKSLDLRSFNTSSVTDMECMFMNCSSLTSLNLSTFNTSSLTSMVGMFAWCSSLTSLNLSSFNTTAVTDMHNMFLGCKSLNNLNLSNFNTSSVKSMERMFAECRSLISLNIANFNMSSLASADYIFDNCTNLNSINTPIKIKISIKLPESSVWRSTDGRTWTSLPQQMSNSLLLKAEPIVSYRRQGRFYFPDAEDESNRNKNHYGEFDINLSVFFNSSYTYQHSLTQTSAALALAALDNTGVSGRVDLATGDYKKVSGTAGRNIASFLDVMEFSDIVVNYPTPNGKDTIGYAIGSQILYEPSGKKDILIVVGVRGSGYGSEWEGNAFVGGSGNHSGFDLASEKVIEGIGAYISKQNFAQESSNIKIWIAGYSRAAATTNIVAAKLDRGRLGIRPENVFAFCFECPKGTVDRDKGEGIYNNIINIINPNDFVPNVAMGFVKDGKESAWKFGRYGRDLELPTDVNTSRKEYKVLFEEMKKYYVKTNHSNSRVEEYTKLGKGQSLIYDNIIANLCMIVLTRTEYVNSSLQGELMTAIRKGLKIDNFIDFLLKLLDVASKRGVVSVATVGAITSDIVGDGKYIAQAHYPELCLAWVYSLSAAELTKDKPYIKTFWNCPIDVEIYDENGILVGAIYNDTVQEIDGGIAAYVDSNGQKVFAYPQDADYTIKVIGTDTGEMTCTVEKFGNDYSNPDAVVAFIDIPVEDGVEYSGALEAGTFVLSDANDTQISPDIEISGDEIEYSSIEIETIGEGIAYAPGVAIPGEVVTMTAEANDGYLFIAWLDSDGNCLSTDTTFKMCVTEDITVTALFSDDDYSECYVVFKPENGETGFYYKADYNTAVTIPAETPVRPGYTFMGWHTGKNGQGTQVSGKMKVRENLILYAYWVKENCTITFETANFEYYNDVSGNVAGIAPVTVPGGSTYSFLSPEPIADYSFGGWFTGENGSGEQYTDKTVITDDVTLYPYWRHTGFSVGSIGDCTYTGTAVQPVINVYDGTHLLVKDRDYTVKFTNNVKVADKNAAKAPTATITGKGNYTGTEKITFSIVPKDLTDDAITAQDMILSYNGGKVIKAVPTLLYNGKALISGKYRDYTYAIYKHDDYDSESGTATGPAITKLKDTGHYKIIVTGCGSFTGTKEIALEVANLTQISKASISKIYDQDYTGTAITPGFNVSYSKKVLTPYTDENTPYDYTVSYSNNTAVGTATVVITGNRAAGFVGTKTVTFKIKGTPISKASVTNADGTKFTTSYMYTGTFIRPKLGLSVKNGKTVTPLVNGVDYTLTYQNNKKVGTGTIIITGIGRYTGTRKTTFKITPYSLKKDVDDIIEVNGTDVINGTVTFLAGEEIRVPYAKGGAKVKDLVLTFNGAVLIEGVDYTVSYSNNKSVAGSEAGKAPTLTIKGKGSFKDSIKFKFNIEKQSILSGAVTMSLTEPAYSTDKGMWKVKPVLKDVNGQILKAGTDYESLIIYTYTENTEVKVGTQTEQRYDGDPVGDKDIIPAGTVIRVGVTGKGGYGATDDGGTVYVRTLDYTIRPASISAATVKVVTQEYTGSAIVPAPSDITVKVRGRSTPLEYGVDYTIESCSDNTDASSKAVITIVGIGNYSGSITRTFTIKAKTIKWWWS